jgi:hypothetical protein
LIIALAVASAACGKKGPPLAPIVRVPAAVTAIEARRGGNDAYVTVTIPAANIDMTVPADVARVEVYAFTGRDSPGARFLEGATLVATIPIEPVARDQSGRPLAAPPGGVRTTNALQGGAVTVRDALTGAALEPRLLPPPPGRRPPPRALTPLVVTPPGPVQRFYTALAFSDRHRPSAQGAIVAVPLGPVPEPPAGVIASYTPDTVQLTWEPSGGLLGFILDRPLTEDASPVEGLVLPPAAAPAPPADPLAPVEPVLPPGPTVYNVYREMAPDPLVLPDGPPPAPWRSTVPAPLTPVPVAAFTFQEPMSIDGRQRCYLVRAVRGAGPAMAESEASPRVCYTPVDIVPPETPTNLAAEAVDGAINLIWDPNIEEDLGGYQILRGAPGDATLTLLTATPVTTARYVDRAVTPGISYVYAVIAVDNRVPIGNVSGESNRDEATAR